MAYRLLDHGGDLALEVTAPTLGELFADALVATTACATDLARVEARRRVDLEAAATAIDLLLVRWLEEGLWQLASGGFLIRQARARVERGGATWRARGTCRGETFDPARHPRGREIKGVTYHGLEVEEHDAGWWAHVVVDL